MITVFTTALALLISRAHAHGYVSSITNATGFQTVTLNPWSSDEKVLSLPAASRRYNTGNPIVDLDSPAAQCGDWNDGDYAAPAKLYIQAEAGTEVKWRWNRPDDPEEDHQWPDTHAGPVTTYLARCPQDDCSTYLPGTDPVWFKIEETGFLGTIGTMGRHERYPDMAGLTLAHGDHTWTTTIPAGVPSGKYIARHEIIALHQARLLGKAQLYPNCHQFHITNGGDIEPTAEELVSFPGAYNLEDPGLFLNIFSPEMTSYQIPGPPVYKGAKASGNAPVPSTNPSQAASSISQTSASQTSTSQTSTSQTSASQSSASQTSTSQSSASQTSASQSSTSQSSTTSQSSAERSKSTTRTLASESSTSVAVSSSVIAPEADAVPKPTSSSAAYESDIIGEAEENSTPAQSQTAPNSRYTGRGGRGRGGCRDRANRLR